MTRRVFKQLRMHWRTPRASGGKESRRGGGALDHRDPGDLDFLWYLWSGPLSPMFGKDRITTLERDLIDDPALQAHVQRAAAAFRDKSLKREYYATLPEGSPAKSLVVYWSPQIKSYNLWENVKTFTARALRLTAGHPCARVQRQAFDLAGRVSGGSRFEQTLRPGEARMLVGYEHSELSGLLTTIRLPLAEGERLAHRVAAGDEQAE